MSKFTLAPWVLTYDYGKRKMCIQSIKEVGHPIVIYFTNDIASFQNPDCILMASAPSLYSAARDALDFLRNCTTDEFSRGADAEIRKQLSAALTLADGEERNL